MLEYGLRIKSLLVLTGAVLVLVLTEANPGLAACRTASVDVLLKDLRQAWEGVVEYQCQVEVLMTMPDESRQVRRFRYHFAEPGSISILMLEPQSGALLTYPHDHGRVSVEMPGLLGLVPLTFDLDSPLLAGPGRQPINQTDLGSLIRNMSRSLTSENRGRPEVAETDLGIVVRVTAKHHFLPEVETAFTFVIDKDLCLPVEVRESLPAGYPSREITFQGLQVNQGLPGPVPAPEGR